jgi:hypothetical protein
MNSFSKIQQNKKKFNLCQNCLGTTALVLFTDLFLSKPCL